MVIRKFALYSAGVFLSSIFIVRCGTERPAICRQYYAVPAVQQESLFKSYPIEKQFEIYECGMKREPPDMGLALYIADGGEKAIPFLLNKLVNADGESAQSYVIDIFEAMSRRGFLRNHPEVIDRITQVVSAMRQPFFKEMGQKSLANIKKDNIGQ
jgi:hypothetical protein